MLPQSYNTKTAGALHLIMRVEGDAKYHGYVANYLKSWVKGENTAPGWTPASFTPGGLAYHSLTSGSLYNHPTTSVLGNAANTAFLALMYRSHCTYPGNNCPDNGITMDELFFFGQNQIDYILGKNGFSFMVGFGASYPAQPYHKGASCATSLSTPCSNTELYKNSDNPNILVGGVVNGPSLEPGMFDTFVDTRTQFAYTGVTTHTSGAVMAALPALIAEHTGCVQRSGSRGSGTCCIGLEDCGGVCLSTADCGVAPTPPPTDAPAETCANCYQRGNCNYWCSRAYNEGCQAEGVWCSTSECSFC
jgi:hypothetical protein